MADLIQTPIVKLDPVGTNDPNAEWLAVTKPADGGIGRVTVRKKYPHGGAGISVDEEGSVSARVDGETVRVTADGKLYATAGVTAVLQSKTVKSALLRLGAGYTDSTRLPVEQDAGNDALDIIDGVIVADRRLTWVNVTITATVECPSYVDNMYLVPVGIGINDTVKKFVIDTTEPSTPVTCTVAVYNQGAQAFPIKLYAFKDAADEDAKNVDMRITYQVACTGA